MIIDSLEIQNLIQLAVKFGVMYLPGNFALLAPIVTALVTAGTAAIIRKFQLKEIHNFHQSEVEQLKQKIKQYETEVQS